MTTKEVFEQGRRAFKYGNIDSPYAEGTFMFREWTRGFNAEYFANLERVLKREKKDLP